MSWPSPPSWYSISYLDSISPPPTDLTSLFLIFQPCCHSHCIVSHLLGVQLPVKSSFTLGFITHLIWLTEYLTDCWLICCWRRKLSQIVCFFCQLFFCHLFLLTCPGHTPVPAGTPISTITTTNLHKYCQLRYLISFTIDLQLHC